MPSQRPPAADLDSPWKEALEHFLPAFLAFFYPAVHGDLHWARGYQSLDHELQQIVRAARTGRRLADKLFRIWRKNGHEAWLLIHIEVQGKQEKSFPERMFVYSYRIYDRYRRPVASLAVLCDDRPGWRPDHFEHELWGCRVGIRFLPVKLLDYRERIAELERDPNPFAAVVLAQLRALETRTDPAGRWEAKVRLIKSLYDRGLTAEQVRQLFRLLDWMLALPPELEQRFTEEIHRFEEERRMPYISSVERIAQERGLEQGRQEGSLETLRETLLQLGEERFGRPSSTVRRALERIDHVGRLKRMVSRLLHAASWKNLLEIP